MKNYGDKGLIGVCIELRNNNYGSMLQSFATQQMLNNYGINYELLAYKKKYTPLYIIKSIPRFFNSVVLQDKFNEYEKKKFQKKYPSVKDDVNKRNNAFTMFREKYFHYPIVTYYGYKSLKENSKKYTAFFSGSDQLWSPSGLPTNFYNLMFAHDEALKISYASSFGVKKIPWYQQNRTKTFLNRIQFISCREESGVHIVKRLTGKNVPVVLDPTMLFTGDEWKSMLPSNIKKPDKYIFSYILGTNKQHRDQVLLLQEKTKLPIVSIHQYVDADMDFGDYSINDAGPSEFVDLIRNAEFVCTDSFHGAVFSILNHKKFIIFNRYSEKASTSKNTRIDNLCSNLGLSNRRYSGNILNNITQNIDYHSVDNKIKILRQKSFEYLEKAFSKIKVKQ